MTFRWRGKYIAYKATVAEISSVQIPFVFIKAVPASHFLAKWVVTREDMRLPTRALPSLTVTWGAGKIFPAISAVRQLAIHTSEDAFAAPSEGAVLAHDLCRVGTLFAVIAAFH